MNGTVCISNGCIKSLRLTSSRRDFTMPFIKEILTTTFNTSKIYASTNWNIVYRLSPIAL